MYMTRILILFFLVPICLQAKTNPDSLLMTWGDSSLPDPERISAFSSYILDEFMYSDPDSAFVLAGELLEFSEQHNNLKGKANALNLQGVSKDIRGSSSQALDLFRKSLAISIEIDDKDRIGASLNNIGIIYEDHGDYLEALDHYEQSLAIYEEIGKEDGIARALGNIGDIYKAHRNLSRALEYYQECLGIRESIGVSTGSSLKDIGEIYLYQDEYEDALVYFNRSYIQYEQQGNKRGMAHSLSNIGKVYKETGEYNRALEYNEQSLTLLEETGDQPAIANLLYNSGDLYFRLGDHQKALSLCIRAKELAEGVDHLEFQMYACGCLYQVHKGLGDGNAALNFHEQMLSLKDSLQLEESAKQLQQMEFERVMLQDSLAEAEKARMVKEAHLDEVRRKNRTRNYLAGVGLLLFIFAIGFYGRWRFVRRSRDEIAREKDRSDNLLLNILPAEIADELKNNGRAEARDYHKVSILFTDFIDFTETSAEMNAKDLVAELNACFEAFDAITLKYGLEKIKTIGDSYMAAGGLPVPSEGSVRNTVMAALEMQKFIHSRNEQRKDTFKMRAGIHTGPVIAGIVGVRKFQYDVWGDTVNTASRMEDLGEEGKVNISESTYNQIKDDQAFSFENRGRIEAKGKGEIMMYFVSIKNTS